MTLKTTGRLSRREMLRALSLCAAGTTLAPFLSGCRDSLQTPESLEKTGRKRDALDGKPKFLIVIGAAGGASIVDSFLAVRQSESANAAALNTFPDAQVQGVADSPFRAVKYSNTRLGSINIPVNTDQLAFVKKHASEMLVATSVGTSVNHGIAQKRSLTGNGAWRGRTLQEAVALQWGSGMPLPNVNMGTGGYAERGTDDSLPLSCFGEPVVNPSLWPLGLDGSRGIAGAPPKDVIALARGARDALDQKSIFGRTFQDSGALKRWNEQRGVQQPKLEALDLITRLNVLPDLPSIPLSKYGLESSPDGARLREVFPGFFTDPVQGQAALAFLLLKYRVSVSVTLGPDFNVAVGGPNGIANPPLAFDISHNDHRGGQAFMWARILSTVDSLITLLKAEPFDADSGESMWDRTLIYVATEFGRTRPRPSGATEFGSGHDLNNGFLLLSPMVKGNTVLGGVDPNTTLTYGFDARTGAPQPGKVTSNEPDIFSGVLTAMGADLGGSGLPDASAFKRA
ncbi:hypothetical protein D7W82_35250 [Corallococcus sp. CA049B]|uniref:hypothetical protein n=1 Tax=Corallococcus sp. CA049B TaxID=2316730 RepID=UPI000EA068DA|nr:hypothetical protein [Corallococcus sp. CA049B]RKG76506.1 hypothetical protein D7W82_35250 [Corallococcus sp. CA049B]